MRTLLNLKVLVGSVITAVVLLAGSFFYISFTRSAPTVPGQASRQQTLEPLYAVLTVIPGPTSTPRPRPTASMPIFPTATASPTPAPGQFAVGVYVQITGTHGEGLRVRFAPDLESDPLFYAYDAEVFLVTDGPQHSDGYTWWYLTAPYDQTRSGWAVQDYLSVIESP